MPEIQIDPRGCTRCGQCHRVCPLRVITRPDGELPHYVPQGDLRCILCGHCEAICPTEALQLDDTRLDPTRYPPPATALAAPELAVYLRMRRSIRHFRPEPVTRAVIDQLLDIVRYAPTGSNSQPVHWLVIHTPREVQRLTALVVDWLRHAADHPSPLGSYFNFKGMLAACDKGRDPICRNAPHLLIAHAAPHAATVQADAHIAMAHLDILAPAFGIGTCWGGFFQTACEEWEPLHAALDLPPGHRPYYAMMLGYPALQYQRPPRRNRLAATWR